MRFNIDEKEARKMLEEMEIPSAKIDEFIHRLPKTDKEETEQINRMKRNGFHMETIQQQYDKEKNPFRKAALAARKISLGLE